MNDFFKEFKKYNLSCISNGVKLPPFFPTKEQYAFANLDDKSSNLEFLTQLCRIGFLSKLKGKIPTDKSEAYIARVKNELEIINRLGFVDYILMVWDIGFFCDKVAIPRGPGRGSSCSSIVCFLCGITSIDPIEHGTIFSRFLNEARAGIKIIDGFKYVDGSLVCDIDNDRCYFRRSEVVDYISKRYPGKTCKMLTISLFSSKILLKDIYKYLENAKEEDANFVSNLIRKEFGVPESIEKALKDNLEFIDWAKSHEETVSIARQIFSLPFASGQHASAVLISFDDISEIMPLTLSKDKELISGYDMYSASQIFLKFDELGLKTVSSIDKICKLTNIKAEEIDIYDKSIYSFFKNNDNYFGIFQLESDAQGRVARKIKPKNFKEISDALAASRPGASDYIDQYIQCIHKGIYNPIHPLIDDVLKDTGGVCLDGDTEVYLPEENRYVKISEMQGYEGKSVQSLDSKLNLCESKINKWIYSGKKEVFEVTLSNGRTIRATKDHLFLSDNGWIKLEDFEMLKTHIAVPKKLSNGDKKYNKNLLRIIGYLIADGYLGKYAVADFVNKDRRMLNEYIKCVQSEYPDCILKETKRLRDVISISLAKKDRSGSKYHDSTGLVAFLRELGLKNKDKSKSTTSQFKFIPAFIFNLDVEHISYFLASLWDCDGHCGKSAWFYKTISKKLAHDIHTLLHICGVKSNIYVSKYKNPVKNNKKIISAYQVNVFDSLKLSNLIQKYFVTEKNLNAPNLGGSEQYIGAKDFFNKIKNILGDRKISHKEFCLKNGIKISYFGKNKQKKVNLTTVKKISNILNLKDFDDLNNVEWFHVKSKKKIGIKDVYDLSVDKNHNFVANSMVVHNCLFQEQYLKMLMKVGLTEMEAEVCRKVLGKKDIQKIPEVKKKIEEVCEKNGHPKEIINVLLKIAEDSGGYQFSLAHSRAYSKITAQTVYLKQNHPREFFLVMLQMANEEADKIEIIKRIHKELPYFGLELKGPRIDKSLVDFTIDGNCIYFGLSSIKGISAKAIEKLEKFKVPDAGKLDLFNASINASIPANIFTALVLAGSLDEHLSKTRSNTLLEYHCYKQLTDKEQKLVYDRIKNYDNDLFLTIKGLNEKEKDEKGRPFIKDSRRATLKKYILPIFEMWRKNGTNENLLRWFSEMRLIGFSYTTNLYELYKNECDNLVTIREGMAREKGDRFRIAAQVTETKAGTGRESKKPYLKLVLSDHTGDSTVYLTTSEREDKIRNCEELNGRLPVAQDIVILNVSKGVDNLWCDQISIQDIKIYEKLSEVKP